MVSKERRNDALRTIKAVLQPYFDDELITKEQFVAICKQTLEWVVSSPLFSNPMNQLSLTEIVQPLIMPQLLALGIAEKRGDTRVPSPVVEPPLGALPSNGGMGLAAEDVDALRSHLERLRTRLYQREQEYCLIDGTTPRKRLMDQYADDASPQQAFVERRAPPERKVPLPDDSFRDDGTCSAAPIDPEETFRRRRLAAQRRGGALQVAAENQSIASRIDTALITGALEQLHQRQEHLITQHMYCMEQKQTLFADEHTERQSLISFESSEFYMIHSGWDSSLRSAKLRERSRCLREQEEHRGILNQQEEREWLDLLENFLADGEVAELNYLRRREREREEERETSPPPPITPRPSRQFDSGGCEVAAPASRRSSSDSSHSPHEHFEMLRKLRDVVTHLPPQQRVLVEQRILLLEEKILSSQQSQFAKSCAASETSLDGHPTPHLSQSSNRRLVADPYAPIHATPLLKKRGLDGAISKGSPSPRRAVPTPTKSKCVVPISQFHKQPSRSEVIEFLRSLLQPLYDEGRLPREVFVEVVKQVSQKFFVDDWMHAAVRKLERLHMMPSKAGEFRAPLWKVYLHTELSDILGDEALL